MTNVKCLKINGYIVKDTVGKSKTDDYTMV